MPGRTDLQHVTITDFSHGIVDDPGYQWPPGTAQRTNTFRCRANKSGSLIPGPRIDSTITGTHFESSTPDSSGLYFISGIYATGPIIPASGSASTKPHELFIATEYGLTAAGGTKKRKLQVIRQFEAVPTTDLLLNESATAASDLTTAWGAVFGSTRANTGTPLNPGIPITVISWGSNNAAFDSVWQHPDETASTGGTNVLVILEADPAIICCHQGRIIFRYITAYNRGTNGKWSTTEDLKYSAVNNPRSLSAIKVFYPENTDGYSLMASMSANELFMLKESGAVVVSGDIADPVVVNLPMVPGNTTGKGSQGVRTQLGFIYPSFLGLYVWAGGDSVQHIADSMLNGFTETGEHESFLANSYLWYNNANLVFLSNNFYLDADLNSFWRLEDESVMQFRYMTGCREWVYGARSTYTNASDSIIRCYNLNLFSNSFSWQSQPLFHTIDTKVTVREVSVRAKGIGTVAITITSAEGTTETASFIFTDALVPHVQMKKISVTGTSCTILITSTGTSGSDDAPTLVEMDYGYYTTTSIPVNSS